MPPCCVLCGKPEDDEIGSCCCDPKDKTIRALQDRIEGLTKNNRAMYDEIENNDLEISAEMRRVDSGSGVGGCRPGYAWTDRGDGNIHDAEFIRYYRRKK